MWAKPPRATCVWLALLLVGGWPAAVQAQNSAYLTLDLVQIRANALHGATIRIVPKNATFLGAGGGAGFELEDFVHADDWDSENGQLTAAAIAGEIRLNAAGLSRITLQGAPAGLSIASARLLAREQPHSHGRAIKGHRSAQITVAYTGPGINADVAVTIAVKGGADGLLTYGNQQAGYPGASCCTAGFTIRTGTLTDGVSVNPVSLAVTERGGAEAGYKVGLLTDPGADVTITATVPAANTSDLEVKAGTGAFGGAATLTFTHGSGGNWTQAQTVTVRAKYDSDTADESFNITHALSVASGPYRSITPAPVAVAVTDAGAGVPLSFSAAAYRANEPASTTNAAVGLTLLSTRPSATVVTVERTGGSATAGDDYTAGPWTATIAANTTTGSVNIPLRHDTVDEPNETVELRIRASSLPTGVVPGSQGTATLTITDNDATSATLSGSGTVKEDGSDSADLAVTLGRKLAGGESVTAPLVIAGAGITRKDYDIALKVGGNYNQGVLLNTASPYSRWSPAVVFTGSDVNTVRVATLAVTGKEDTRDEGVSETLTVNFGSGDQAVSSNLDRSSGTGAAGTTASGSASVAITDNDQPPSLAVSPDIISARNLQDGGTATLTLIPKNSTFFGGGGGGGLNGGNPSAPYVFFDDRNDRGEIPNTEVRLSATGLSKISLSGTSAFLTISAGRLLPIQYDVHGAEQHRSVEIDLSYAGPLITADDQVTVAVDSDLLRFGDQNGGRPASQSARFTVKPLDPNAGLSIRETGSPAETVVGENGGTDRYAVLLKTRPTHPVTVTVTAGAGTLVDGPDAGNAGTSTETLTFNPKGSALWSTPQTITVTGVDDDIDNAGNARTVMIGHAASSNDHNYAINSAGSLGVKVTDDDRAGVTISHAAHTLAEHGGVATYTLKLDSQPLKAVTITVDAGDGNVVKVDGPDSATDFTNTEALTFTPSNWRSAQQISIEGQNDDAVTYLPRTATITHSIASPTLGDGRRYLPDMVIAGVDVSVSDDDKPVLTLTEKNGNTEIGEGGSATFTVTSSDPAPSGGLPVTLPTLSFSGAYSGSLSVGTITIPANATNVDFNVDIDDDRADALDGAFTVSLNTGTPYELGAASSLKLAVTDNDPTSVTLAGSPAGYLVEGGAKTLTLTLGRGLVKGETLTAPLTFAGTAARNVDYRLTSTAARGVAYNNLGSGSASVVFTGPAAGTTATVATITFTATSDSVVGSTTDTVGIGLGTATNTGSGGGVTATDNLPGFHIVDSVRPSEPIVTLSQPDKTTLKEGGDAVEFDLLVSPPYFQQPFSLVTLELAGKAASGQDYRLEAASGGSVSSWAFFVNQGVSSMRLRLVPLADDRDEPNESIVISVPDQLQVYRDAGNAAYTVSAPRSVRFTLTSATAPPPPPPPVETPGVTVSTASLDLAEGGSTGSYTVLLDSKPTANVTVTAASGDAAKVRVQAPGGNPGTSATLTFTPTTWNQAQAVTVTPQDDANADDETVTITHAVSNTGGYGGVTADSVTVTVDDDETPVVPPPSVSIAPASANAVTEGAAATFTLTASPAPQSAITVNVNVMDSGSYADSGQAGSRQVTIGTGGSGTLTVTTDDDSADEPNGTLTATVNSGTSYAPSNTNASASITVDDNDDPPPATPVVSISGGGVITEGGTATFNLSASPAPPSTITVDVNVVDSGSFADSGQAGARQVTIGTGGSGTLTVTTDNDSADEPNGTLTATVNSGTGYTPSDTNASASISVNDDDDAIIPSACVSDALLQQVEDYYDHNSITPPGYGHNWFRVLVAFGARTPADWTTDSRVIEPMTAASARVQEAIWFGWGPVADALECLEAVNPAPDPEVAIAGGSAVTEGGSATFTLTATPTPSTSITVNVNVADSGDFANSGQAGSRTVTIGAGGSGTLIVTTDNDSTDEPDGTLTATIANGQGYTPSGTSASASIAVSDNDDPPPPVVSITGGSAITEGGAATFTLTATPAPASPITVNLNVVDSGNFADGGQAGARTATIGTNGSGTLTVTTDNDSTDEPSGTLTATIANGQGYTPSNTNASASIAVSDNDDAITPSPCVSDVLLQQVEDYYDHNSGNSPGYGENWFRVLVAFGARTPADWTADNRVITPMTAASAREREARWFGWGPVADALECIEGVSPDPDPAVTIAGGGAITEGGTATFTLTATPTPQSTTTVNISVVDSGSFASSGQVGLRQVTIGTGGSGTLTVLTTNDSTDEPDGTLTATVTSGTGYTRSNTNASASISVTDNDDPPPATPVVSISGGGAITEGGTATFNLSASPAPQGQITVNVNVADSGSFADSGQTGSRRVTIGTGGSGTFTVTTANDSTNEPNGSISATVTSGTGYSVHSQNNSDSVTVNDNDLPPPRPAVSISGGSAITEGGSATFTLTASPPPQGSIRVNVRVTQSGNFATSGQTGSRRITIGASGTATFNVTTTNDSDDEPDGSVSAAVIGGTGYSVHSQSNSDSVTVNDDDVVVPVIRVTSAQSSRTTDYEGATLKFTLHADVAPGADLEVTVNVAEPGNAFVNTADAGARQVTIPARQKQATLNVRTNDDSVEEDPASATVTVTVQSGSGYTAASAPRNSAEATVHDNDGLPTLSIGDSSAQEGDEVYFQVTLSKPVAHEVRFSYYTETGHYQGRNYGTANSSSDYPYSSNNGTIYPGGRRFEIWIQTFDDSYDEGDETFTVILSRPEGATLDDGEATGTIKNSDPLPDAWLARFGRAVAEQALDGITARIGAVRKPARAAGFRSMLAGRPIGQGPGATAVGCTTPSGPNPPHPAVDPGAGDVGTPDHSHRPENRGDGSYGSDGSGRPDGLEGRAKPVAGCPMDNSPDRTLGSTAPHAHNAGGIGAGSGHRASIVSMVQGHGGPPPPHGDARGTALQQLLTGSNFTYTREADAKGGVLGVWGRGSHANFNGAQEELRLDGNLTTGLLGVDYARGDWLLGVAITQAVGDGTYSGPNSAAGGVRSTLTAAVPYAAWRISERLDVWGAAGHGGGRMTLTSGVTTDRFATFLPFGQPARRTTDLASPQGERLQTDLGWSMAALGLNGSLLGAAGAGPMLTWQSDALWSRTTSDETEGMLAGAADVTRLRFGLEGSWRLRLGDHGLTPKLEVGVRHDGGDAETGFGVEVGGGVAWLHPGLGLSLDLEGRTLIAHEANRRRDMGFSAALAFDPSPQSRQGPKLSLRQDFGGQVTGGLDALFAANPLVERRGHEADGRWTAEAAWGFPTFRGRFIGAPTLGYGVSTMDREYSIGWQLEPFEGTGRGLSFGLKLTRRESLMAPPAHGIGAELRMRW